jgi:hypothetical protein
MVSKSMVEDLKQKHEASGKSVFRRIAALLCVIPWVVLDVIWRGEDPSLGYAVGIVCGVLTVALFAERPPKLWIMFVIGVLLAISHFILAHSV